MKKIFFLVGLPRAGNTLLGSILNQNPDIAVTANSITPDILYNLFRIKDSNLFQNYPDHKSLNNVVDHVFELYYKDWKCKYIVDRSCWGTPATLQILKKVEKDIKIIILVRDIIEVLASFIRWSQNHTDTFIHRYNARSVEEKCERLMQEAPISRSFLAINNLFLPEHKNLYHLIEYNDLVEHPRRTIEGVYNYLKIPPFKHHYVNLNQFEVNGMKYNDTIPVEGLHTIKTDRISKSNYNAYDLIPKNIVEKYKKFNVWKN